MRHPAARLALALLIACLPPVAGAQEPHRQQLAEKLRRDLREAAERAPGVVGIAVLDLTSGDRVGVNDTLVFPQGSAIKIPILLELFKRADAGEVDLKERLTLKTSDQVGGSGLLRYFSDGGSAFSLHDLAIPMIVLSDNTATNMLIERLGMDRVNATMAALGAPNTKLRRLMIRPESSARGDENVSTAREAVDLMARIARCDLPMKPESCREVKRILALPKGGPFREPIPSSIEVAWKPGGIEGVQTAWGIVDVPGGAYAVAVMVNYGPANMDPTIRELSAIVYRYFTQIARTTPHGTRVPLEYLKKDRK